MALLDGLHAYWKFDKNSSTQVDSGPYGLHGTVTGSVTSVAAVMNNGVQFGGAAGDYINVPTSPWHRLWRPSTIGIVVKVNSYATGGAILSKVGASSFPAGFRTQTPGPHFYITEGGTNKFDIVTWVPADGNFHWVVVTHDTGTNMEVFVDGTSRGTAISGYYWMSENIQLRMGAPDASFYGSGTTSGLVTLDEIAMWNRVLSGAEITSWYNSGAGNTLPVGNITTNEVGQYVVYQRHKSGSQRATVSRSGTYTTGTPTAIEYSVYDHTTEAKIQGWDTIKNATISGGTWSGDLDLPQHTNWVKLKVQSKDSTGTVIETGEMSYGKVGVGVIFLTAGQSNMAHMADWYTGTFANDKTSLFNSSVWAHTLLFDGANWDYIGDGIDLLMDKLQAAYGCPVGMIHAAVGGSGLYQADGGGYWLDTGGGSPYALCLIQLAAAGGDVEGILWHQGEADAHSSTSKANHYNSLTTLYNRLLAVIGRTASQCKMGVGSLGKLIDGSTAANIAGICQAQLEWSRNVEGAYYLGSNKDATLFDNYHYTSYVRIARRWAQSMIHRLLTPDFDGGGPRICAAYQASGSEVVRVVLSMRGNASITETDLTTDGVGLTAWEVSNDDFATNLTISSTAFVGNEVQLTLSAVPTGTVKVRYQYGTNPTTTNLVYGNQLPQGDTLGCPLSYTESPIIVTSVPNFTRTAGIGVGVF